MKLKIFIKSLIFIITACWFLSGGPVIWQNPRLPPKIQEVNAAYDDVVLGTNGGPTYRIKFNGNITESIAGQGTSGNPYGYVSNIIPNDTGQSAEYTGSQETVISTASDVNNAVTYRKIVSFWVIIDTFGTGTGASSRNIWEEGGGTNWWTAYTSNSDELRISIGESNVDEGNCVADGLSTGTLYYVVMQWEGLTETMELWVNGVLADSTQTSTGGSLAKHTGDWEIGGDSDARDHTSTSIGSLRFDGRIGDYAYWAEPSRLLTEEEIVAIYNAGVNSLPSLAISQPDGASDTVIAGQSYNITYDLSDTEDAATVDFYYDSDSSGLDGTAITGCQDQAEGTGATCSWDTTGMTPGDYYVYGIATDGVNPNVNDYSPGMVTIQAAIYSVAITPAGTIEYGIIPKGESKSTIQISETKTATNDGNTAEKLNIKTSNAVNGTSWVVGSAAGDNIFVHEFSTNGGEMWTKFDNDTDYKTLSSSVEVDGNVDFDLRITVPTDSDAQEKTITVTIQAVAP